MNSQIEKLIKNLPKKPGVYRFKDKDENMLYVGKAINLKNRVNSYFKQTNKLSLRIQKMVSQIEDIEYTIVSSDLEAIILETNLIKEYRPKYNIRMMDDKNFVYIKISQNDDFPQISIVRKVLNDKALYFGPKTAANKVQKTLDVLKKIFPYRHCNLFLKYEGPGKVHVENKTLGYPCLDYHIKRCIGPCIGNCSKEEYNEMIQQIIRFLKGKSDEIIENLAKEMQKAAADKNFEKAAKIRDKLQAIQEIIEKQLVSAPNGEDNDVINYSTALGRLYFTLFMIRDGKLINQENFIFKAGDGDEKYEDTEEILEYFLNQYYSKATDFPKKIIVPHEFSQKIAFEEWISGLKGAKAEFIIPQKGEKHKILELALKNAESFANSSKIKWQANEAKTKKALEELKEKLSLTKIPRRIECYDISHISGTNQVASMVVFENGSPSNKKYRRFKIRTVAEGKPDDFAAMLEVLKRRFLYLVESKTNVKFRKCGKKDIKDYKKYLKGSIGKEIIGFAKHDILKELEYFHDVLFNGVTEEQKKEFILGLIDKSGKNRVYITTKKQLIGVFEQVGFQIVKKAPDEIKLKKSIICLLFNKKKYSEENEFTEKPDLIVIDGGKGQLAQGVKVQKKFKMAIPMVALAKKNEEVFIPEKPFPIEIKKDSEGLYLLQQIRDESHRFALAYHQKLREKDLIK